MSKKLDKIAKKAIEIIEHRINYPAQMVAINVAVMRPDGKVECDTLYRKSMLTKDEVKEMGEKVKADVIVSCIGYLVGLPDEVVQANSIFYKHKKEEDLSDGTEGTTGSDDENVAFNLEKVSNVVQ